MRTNPKHFAVAACLAALLLLPSCALLPEEEAPRTAPMLKTYEREAFKTAFVEREDLVLSEKISCIYVPVQTASLAFALGGEYVDEIMVQTGDSVVKGQLLGQLRLDDLQTRIASTEDAIAELELRISYLEGQRALALRRQELQAPSMDEQSMRNALDAVEQDYDRRRQSLEDSLYLQKLTLATLQADLEERQLRAPFDGTITYVRKYEEGAMSVFAERVVTIADSTLSLFRASTEYWSIYSPGDVCEIAVGNALYPAVVATEESLGLPAQKKTEGEAAYVYFTLKEPSFDLEDGDRGTLVLVLEERRGVLTVPSNAIAYANGQPIVYYQKEDGMKAYKPVEIGLTVGKRTEVLSGLVEGESIIVE